jgi:DNA-binding MarR family transcriptional regulator
MKTLTEQQGRVLGFVEDHIRRQGYPPTLREIGEAVGLANVNAVRGHLDALQRKGFVVKDPDKARSIRIVSSPSPLSLLKRKLHKVLQTDRGVFHRIVYGLAWKTADRLPYLIGPRRAALEEAIEAEAVERGWRIVEKHVASDHAVVVVETWPNHSAETAVQRLQSAGRRAVSRHLAGLPGGRIWAGGYVATTDLGRLDDLVRRFLEDASEEEEASP